jgi:hypothetical protein
MRGKTMAKKDNPPTLKQILRNMRVALTDGDWRHPNPTYDRNIDILTKPFEYYVSPMARHVRN